MTVQTIAHVPADPNEDKAEFELLAGKPPVTLENSRHLLIDQTDLAGSSQLPEPIGHNVTPLGPRMPKSNPGGSSD